MAWVQGSDSELGHWYARDERAVCDRHPIPPGNARMTLVKKCIACDAVRIMALA